MDETRMDSMRKTAKDIRKAQTLSVSEFKQMTAPCGLPCFECYMHLASHSHELRTMISEEMGIPSELAVCKGCRNEGGKCAHLPVPCNVYPCAEKKGVHVCSECHDFPCDLLHPYQDMAQLWHNTKVFNLCLIKKMGLASWAQQKAGSVLDTYSFGKWTL